jgi:hypothetical protein
MEHAPEAHPPAGGRLQVMVRDPNWVFLYWELPDAARRAAPAGATWVIRFLDVRRGEVREIPVEPEAANWYAPVAPQSELETELGVYGGDGEYRTVLRGNPVRMPPLSVSDEIDPNWYVSDEEFFRLFVAGQEGRPTSASGRPVAQRPVEEYATWPLSPLTSSHDAQKKPRFP